MAENLLCVFCVYVDSVILGLKNQTKLLKHEFRLDRIKTLLTHLCRVDSSVLALWTGPFPIKRARGYFFYDYHVIVFI